MGAQNGKSMSRAVTAPHPGCPEGKANKASKQRNHLTCKCVPCLGHGDVAGTKGREVNSPDKRGSVSHCSWKSSSVPQWDCSGY